MPDDTTERDETQEFRERTRSLEEQIQGAKDGTLRLWERNRNLHESQRYLGRRMRVLTWLVLAGVGGSAAIAIGTVAHQRVQLQQQIAELHASLTLLQARIAELDRAANTQEGGRKQVLEEMKEAQSKQIEAAVVAAIRKMAPEMLAEAVTSAAPGVPSGQGNFGITASEAQGPGARNQDGIVRSATHDTLRIAAGKTTPQAAPWVQYNTDTIYVDVDTSPAGFSSTPQYFTSLGGHTNSLLARGVTSVYQPTAQGFRIHVTYPHLTVAQAKEWGWYINWAAIGQ